MIGNFFMWHDYIIKDEPAGSISYVDSYEFTGAVARSLAISKNGRYLFIMKHNTGDNVNTQILIRYRLNTPFDIRTIDIVNTQSLIISLDSYSSLSLHISENQDKIYFIESRGRVWTLTLSVPCDLTQGYVLDSVIIDSVSSHDYKGLAMSPDGNKLAIIRKGVPYYGFSYNTPSPYEIPAVAPPYSMDAIPVSEIYSNGLEFDNRTNGSGYFVVKEVGGGTSWELWRVPVKPGENYTMKVAPPPFVVVAQPIYKPTGANPVSDFTMSYGGGYLYIIGFDAGDQTFKILMYTR